MRGCSNATFHVPLLRGAAFCISRGKERKPTRSTLWLYLRKTRDNTSGQSSSPERDMTFQSTARTCTKSGQELHASICFRPIRAEDGGGPEKRKRRCH